MRLVGYMYMSVLPRILEHMELDRKCVWVAEAKWVTLEVISRIICIFIRFLHYGNTSSKELSLQFIVISVSNHWLVVIMQSVC